MVCCWSTVGDTGRLQLARARKIESDSSFLGQSQAKPHGSASGRGPYYRVVVSTAAFHASVRGSVPGPGGLKETKMFLPHPRVKVSIMGSLRDREVACSASDRQGSNFESCVWRTVSSQSSHHPQEVLLAQFSLYVHKGVLKPDSFHFIFGSASELKIIETFVFYMLPAYAKISHVTINANAIFSKHKFTFEDMELNSNVQTLMK